MTEPTTNATPVNPRTAATCSLSGYMDMHMHMFADMAHGGCTLAGKPFDPIGGVNAALRPDYTTSADLVYGNGVELGKWADAVDIVQTDGSFLADFLQGLRIGLSLWVRAFAGCPANLFGSRCTSEDYFHGPHDALLGDPIGSFLGTQDGAASNYGAPLFNGWPKWTSTTHQQVYYKWLERAWQGGLRMMTEFAVTNEALCKGNKHLKGVNCENSMGAIDAQLEAAYAFQTFIDAQHGGAGKGWYRIVKTPLEARVAVASGKLAVVLGIETAELFNCNEQGTCNEQFVRNKVDQYYDKGVRQVFPIHNFDNAFGAAATWQDGIEVGQRAVEGRWWDTRDCGPESYTFKLGSFTQSLISLLKFSSVIPSGSVPQNRAGSGHCNQYGLKPLGEVLMDALMDKGMIIDVDHMSTRSLDRALGLAEGRANGRYSGIVASHVLPLDLHGDITVGLDLKRTRHERLRTADQMARIRNLGGMIAAMLKDDGQDTSLKGEKYTTAHGTAVPDDCRHSSKSFAQAYMYAVDQMRGPVALGSDFNGVAGHVGPRFGVEACGGSVGERNAQIRQGKKVSYPFIFDGFGTFNKQVTGQRTFDYNVDGMAHVGMLPDFVSDLREVGLPVEYERSLFGSAEAYIKMWEGATRATDTTADDTPQAAVDNACAWTFIPSPPSVTATVTPPANAAGWHKTPPTVTWTVTATSSSGIATKTGCENVTIAADTSGTTLTCTATNVAGQSASASVTIRLDQVAPTVTFDAVTPPANINGWHSQNVSVPYSVADDRSGLPAGSPSSGSLTFSMEGQGMTQLVTAFDVAGNQKAVLSPPVSLDRTKPTIHGARVTEPNAHGWNNGPVTTRFSAEDALSGLEGPPATDIILSTEGGGQSVSLGAIDRAGNTAAASVDGINIDLTPPSVTGTRAPEANQFGWNKVDVNVRFACADALSGIDACSPDATVSSEAANQSRTGTGRDRAGNEAVSVVSGISIDKTAPTIAGAADRPPNARNWYNANVSIVFTCNDTLSGIGSCGPTPQVISTEGANLSRSGIAADRAGNTAAATVAGINLDKTAPIVTCANPAPRLWPPNHKMVPIEVTVSVADGLSTGLSFTLKSATSNEPDNGLGDGDTAGDIQGFVIGTASTRGAVRAERSGTGIGRIYSLTYGSLDLAGNTGLCTTTVMVPHSNNGK